MRGELRAVDAFEASLSETADRLHPSEDLLDALADALAHGVAGEPRRACVDRGAAPLRALCNVRDDVHFAAAVHEVAGVVALVARDRDALLADKRLADHLQRASALRVSGRGRDTEIDEQAIAILHQRVRAVRELRLFAEALARELRLGI